MKQIFLALSLFLLPLSAQADERAVKFEQLPAKAQQFVTQYFDSFKLSYAKYDSDISDQSYDVVFTNGTKIEFGRRGDWEKIECRRETRVPEELMPSTMVQYIADNHAKMGVVEIERNMRSYEVRLSNGIELIFDNSGTFKRYDR